MGAAGELPDVPLMQIGRLVGTGVAGLGLVGAGYAGLAGQDDSTRDESGAIVDGGEVGAFRIRLGDCFGETTGEDLESVDAVPCDQLHRYEVYAAFNLPYDDGAAFPGRTTVQEQADLGCLERFDGFVGAAYETSIYGIGAITPSEGSWDEVDDREVLCLISNYDGSSKSGSAEGTGV